MSAPIEPDAVRPSPGLRRPPHTVAAWLLFLLPLLALAFAEEGLWDRLVWHDHPMFFPLPELFPPSWLLVLLLSLLSLPQSAHDLLDSWIWRVGPQNPELRRQLGLSLRPVNRARQASFKDRVYGATRWTHLMG